MNQKCLLVLVVLGYFGVVGCAAGISSTTAQAGEEEGAKFTPRTIVVWDGADFWLTTPYRTRFVNRDHGEWGVDSITKLSNSLIGCATLPVKDDQHAVVCSGKRIVESGEEEYFYAIFADEGGHDVTEDLCPVRQTPDWAPAEYYKGRGFMLCQEPRSELIPLLM